MIEDGEFDMDYMVRATAANDQIRAFAATTRDMVEAAREAHNTSPVATAALGRLLTGGAMMGAMMKGENDLLTLQVHSDGPLGGIVVTADSHGNAKGYVYNPDVRIHANRKGKLDVSGAVGHGTLQVIQDLGLKEPYIGSCDLQTGEIAEDLTYYFAVSEQVPSSVGLGVLMDRDNTVRRAGGFILQLMPDTSDATVDALEKRLSEVRSVTSMLDEGRTPEDILNLLLDGFEPQFTQTMPLRWRCDCSVARVENALISIGDEELRSMIKEGKTIEVACHFCNKKYHFSIDELKKLKSAIKAGDNAPAENMES